MWVNRISIGLIAVFSLVVLLITNARDFSVKLEPASGPSVELGQLGRLVVAGILIVLFAAVVLGCAAMLKWALAKRGNKPPNGFWD